MSNTLMISKLGAKACTIEELVLEVNRVFHDLEGSAYQQRHDEIFVAETQRWQAMAKKFVKELRQHSKGHLKFMDVGSGTGFVPQQLALHSVVGDQFHCMDLSRSMLNVCRENNEVNDFLCQFHYHLIDGKSYPLQDASIDMISMNSVLHHVPDISEFLGELDRMLTPGGMIVIGHEPNRSFYINSKLWRRSRLVACLSSPRQALSSFLHATGIRQAIDTLGLLRLSRSLYHSLIGKAQSTESEHATILEQVNQSLLASGHISSPLSDSDISQLVDFHSPTAGEKVDKQRGIDLKAISESILPNYEIRLFETYNHLGQALAPGSRWANLESKLAEKAPNDGATFFAVLQKKKTC